MLIIVKIGGQNKNLVKRKSGIIFAIIPAGIKEKRIPHLLTVYFLIYEFYLYRHYE